MQWHPQGATAAVTQGLHDQSGFWAPLVFTNIVVAVAVTMYVRWSNGLAIPRVRFA